MIESARVSSVGVMLGSLLLVLVSLFFPLSTNAAPTFLCITAVSSTGGTVTTQMIEPSAWAADKCYNDGPNGQVSNLVSNLINVGNSANEMCTPVIPGYECGMVPGPVFGVPRPGLNKNHCPCLAPVPNVPGGVVEGVCVAQNVCEGLSYSGLLGDRTGVGDFGGIVTDIFKGLIGQALQNIGSQNGGTSDANGCYEYYTVTAPSSDPCAEYVPNLSDTILDDLYTPQGPSTAQQLLDALNSGSGGTSGGAGGNTQSTATQLLNLINGQSNTQSGSQNSITNSQGQQTAIQGSLSSQTVALNADGTRGDIQITGTGATIFAGSRDVTGGTEIAGFYGGDTGGFGQPQGIAARLCLNRPWASSFVSYIIPSAVFDGLCSWRGYQVGFPAYTTPSSSSGSQTTTFSTPTSIPSTQVFEVIEPRAEIWSVPKNVTIGSRASIFWNTKDVQSCTISSSDGSFSESSLSGGAATVPIIDATTFTILCVTKNGTTITDEVTVGLGV